MKFFAWIKASRPPAYVNTFFPTLLGQLLAVSYSGVWDWTIFAWLAAINWLQQLYIVFWNDYADEAADRLNENYTPFSGGSRVLPEQQLTKRSLWRAGTLASVGVLIGGSWLSLFANRHYLLIFLIAGWLLLIAYSLPPFRLNYRGGGEFLQMFGCAIVLPLMGYYAQLNTLDDFPWLVLLPFAIYHLASAIATTVPDRAADKIAAKNTLAVSLGVDRTLQFINILVFIGPLAAFFAGHFENDLQVLMQILLPMLLLPVIIFAGRNLGTSRPALLVFNAAVVTLPLLFVLGYL